MSRFSEVLSCNILSVNSGGFVVQHMNLYKSRPICITAVWFHNMIGGLFLAVKYYKHSDMKKR